MASVSRQAFHAPIWMTGGANAASTAALTAFREDSPGLRRRRRAGQAQDDQGLGEAETFQKPKFNGSAGIKRQGLARRVMNLAAGDYYIGVCRNLCRFADGFSMAGVLIRAGDSYALNISTQAVAALPVSEPASWALAGAGAGTRTVRRRE